MPKEGAPEDGEKLALRPGVGDLLVTQANSAVQSNLRFEDSLGVALRNLVRASGSR